MHPKDWLQGTRLYMKSVLAPCEHLTLESQLRLYADSFKSGAKDFLLLLFLNCSEVYSHRRPLDSTDADFVKFYDKTGFEQSEDSNISCNIKAGRHTKYRMLSFFCKKIKKIYKNTLPLSKIPAY